MLSVWMPKTSETVGEPLRRPQLAINDNLLLVRICKQRWARRGGGWRYTSIQAAD